MKLSIVIPLYNKQETIHRAMISVLDQISSSDCNVVQENELITVDDGSRDNSLTVARRIQREHTDRNIIIHSQRNAGVSAARNKGVELASADYVAFLDGDDSYEPNFISEIVRLIKEFPMAAMFATSYRLIDSNSGHRRKARMTGLKAHKGKHLLSDYFYSAAHGDLPVTSSSVCIRKSALIQIGSFPVGENMGEDQAVWSQMALKHEIALSSKVCANYFLDTNNSLMNTVAPSKEMPFSQRLQAQLYDKEIQGEKIESIQQYIAGHLLDLCRRNIQIGDLANAKKLLEDPRSSRLRKRWVYAHLKLGMAFLFKWAKLISRSSRFDGVNNSTVET